MIDLWIISLLLSAILWTFGYFLLKLDLYNKSHYHSLICQIIGSSIILLILLLYFLQTPKFNLLTLLNNSYKSVLAGICFSIGTLFFIYSLKYGKNVPSVRILGIVFEMIIVIILSCLYLNEKITLTNYLGILITLIGIGIIIYFE